MKKIKRFFMMDAFPILRTILLGVVLIVANSYLYLVGFIHLDVDSFLKKTANIICQNSPLILVILTSLLSLSFTYQNRKTFFLLISEFISIFIIAFIESRFIINEYFDSLFWIGLLFIILLNSVKYIIVSLHKSDYYEASNKRKNPFLPIDDDCNLYDSRKQQLKRIVNIINNDELVGDGVSICLSGKWGSGKTSFVNSVISKIKKDDVQFEEIRINALELEDKDELIKYYASSIKNVLKDNNAYVGIKSEYSALIQSFVKLSAGEGLANSVIEKFDNSTDYRTVKTELNNLINKVMENKRLIIIVDDLDRCSDKKVLEFIFFVKEFATLNRCVSIFLVDAERLSRCFSAYDYEVDPVDFLDKFFDVSIGLKQVDFSEIIKGSEGDDFNNVIQSIIDYNQQSLEEAQNSNYLYIQDQIERESHKNEVIREKESIIEETEKALASPRKIKKVQYKFNQLLAEIDFQKKEWEKCEDYSEESIDKFLNNIDYKKQLLLISIIYGYHSDVFKKIDSSGLNSLETNKLECFEPIIYDEWENQISDYFTSLKINFVNRLLENPDSIKQIINPFDSKFQLFRSYISEKRIPTINNKEVTFEECFDVIYTYKKLNKELLKTMYIVYSKHISFDDALKTTFGDRVKEARDSAFKEFYDVFCKKEHKIENISNCKLIYHSTFGGLLWKKMLGYKVYLSYLPYDFNHIEETVFNHKTVEESIQSFLNEMERIIEVSIKGNSSVKKLEQLLDLIEDKYKSEHHSVNSKDYKYLKKFSLNAISEISYIQKIEQYILSYNKNDHSVNEEKQKQLFEKVKMDLYAAKEETCNFNAQNLGILLSNISSAGLTDISNDDFEQLIEMLTELDLGYAVQARKLLIKVNKQ